MDQENIKTVRTHIMRTVLRVPLPALVLVLFCCIFVISQYQYPVANIRHVFDTSKSAIVALDSLPKRKASTSPPTEWNGSTEDEQIRPSPPRWTYVCNNNACTRREAQEKEVIQSLDVCWLTCSSRGSVWPFPSSQNKGPDTVKFLPENLQLVQTSAPSENVKQLMQKAFQIKKNYFENFPGLNSTPNSSTRFAFIWPFGSDSHPGSVLNNNVIKLSIECNSTEEILSLSTDESYTIIVKEDTSVTNGIHLSVSINANTFFGVRHGLETFSQLVALDASRECLQILRSYDAHDQPKYPYRGILIDTARNFVPLDILRRIIDAMSYNKLNMLHLHLTDSNSFTFQSNRVPQMTQYGSLSENQIYSPAELRELVKYAKIRGVKIIPELDAPSHAGNGWQFGKKFDLGDLAFYINVYDPTWKNLCGQPPCGILNPANIHVYNILEKLYADLFEVFDKDLFHMGGDEVNLPSWTKLPELRSWLMSHKLDGMGLWKHFQTQAFERLRNCSKTVTAILWTSSLTDEESRSGFLEPSNYIIQVWESANSKQIGNLLNKGFSLILSYVDKFYLDWGGGTWLGREHEWKFHNWQAFYDTKIDNVNVKRKKQILGAEAPLWSEKMGPWQVEVKLWPRAAALAENLWSDPNNRDEEVYSRLNYHNYRMQRRGIPTSQLQPESCLHYNGHCRNPSDVL